MDFFTRDPIAPPMTTGESVSSAMEDHAVPLFVDLDGTVLSTDLLWESFLGLLREQPWQLWRIPGWLLRGRAVLKKELAVRGRIDVMSLPYRAEVLDYLRHQREAGRTIVLATASNETLAQQVTAHLGLFDALLASDAENNLKGRRKLEAIQAYCGPGVAFDYVGDARADLAIWSAARRPVVVHAGNRLLDQVRHQGHDPERGLIGE